MTGSPTALMVKEWWVLSIWAAVGWDDTMWKRYGKAGKKKGRETRRDAKPKKKKRTKKGAKQKKDSPLFFEFFPQLETFHLDLSLPLMLEDALIGSTMYWRSRVIRKV